MGSPRGAISGRIARGGLWLIGSAVATRVISFAVQIALGWLLVDEDFGTYAIAISIGALASILRDGGARQILIERGWRQREYVGPAFWLGGALNGLAAGTLALSGPFFERVYGEPTLSLMLLLIASGLVLGTPSAVFRSKLSYDLRMRELATLRFLSAIVRYGGIITLALAGYGPLSFVLPVPLIAIAEGVLGYLYTREKPWKMSPRFDLWRETILKMRWVVLGVGAMGIFNMGPHMAVGLAVPTAVLGVYFFAYQIVLQIGAILSANINDVLFPSFVHIQSDRPRLTDGALKSLRVSSLMAVFACVALAAAILPLELLLWGGKWRPSVLPVQILALAYPLTVTLAVGLATQQAKGNFRAWGLSLLGLAAGSVFAHFLGAVLTGSATGIALVGGVGGAAMSVLYLGWMFRSLGVSPTAVMAAAVHPWLIGMVASLPFLVMQAAVAPQTSTVLSLLLFPLLVVGATALLMRGLARSALEELFKIFPLLLAARTEH